jgi:hypothetical protein
VIARVGIFHDGGRTEQGIEPINPGRFAPGSKDSPRPQSLACVARAEHGLLRARPFQATSARSRVSITMPLLAPAHRGEGEVDETEARSSRRGHRANAIAVPPPARREDAGHFALPDDRRHCPLYRSRIRPATKQNSQPHENCGCAEAISRCAR